MNYSPMYLMVSTYVNDEFKVIYLHNAWVNAKWKESQSRWIRKYAATENFFQRQNLFEMGLRIYNKRCIVHKKNYAQVKSHRENIQILSYFMRAMLKSSAFLFKYSTFFITFMAGRKVECKINLRFLIY